MGFLKWLTTQRGQLGLGFSQTLALTVAACVALPALMWLLQGQWLFGVLASVVTLGLAWLPMSSLIARYRASSSELSPPVQPQVSGERKDKSDTTALRVTLKKLQQDRAISQLNELNAALAEFRKIVSTRFNPNELTAVRYSATATQVHDGAMDSIHAIADAASSVAAIDPDKLVKSLDQLIADRKGDSDTAVALRERIAVAAEARRHIEALLGTNEQAIASLNRVTTRLAQIERNTAEQSSAAPLSDLIADLDELAARSDKYAKPTIEPTR